MKKRYIFLFLILFILNVNVVKAAKFDCASATYQCISCTYKVPSDIAPGKQITYYAKADGTGGVDVTVDYKNTLWGFITGGAYNWDPQIKRDAFISASGNSLACPNVYIKAVALAGNKFNIRVAFDKSDEKADDVNKYQEVYRASDTDNGKEFRDPNAKFETTKCEKIPIYILTDGLTKKTYSTTGKTGTVIKGGYDTYTLEVPQGFTINGKWNKVHDEAIQACDKSLIIACQSGKDQYGNKIYACSLDTSSALNGRKRVTGEDGDDSNEPGIGLNDKDWNPDKLCGENNENCNLDITKFCTDKYVSRTLKFLGILLYIAKILVPAIIIVLGFVDLAKIVLSGKVEDAKKEATNIFKRIVIGIIIFVIPTIIVTIYNVANNIASGENDSDLSSDLGIPSEYTNFTNCVNCILAPSKCQVFENTENN